MKLSSALQLLVLVSNLLGIAYASTKSPGVVGLPRTHKHHEQNNENQRVLPHWTDLSYRPGTTSTTSTTVEGAFITTFQPLVVSKEKKAPLRLALFVEPCPFTYVSGYANRFQELLRHLERKMADQPGSALEIVTAENIVKDRPSEAFGFPIRYSKGFLLPYYPLMTVAFDYTLQTFRSVRSMKPNLIHASSPGFMAFKAIFLSKILSIPLILSYHTHLPVYVRTYVHPKWLSAISERLVWMIIGVAHSMADATVVTSPQIQAEFLAHNIPRVNLWDKGIDTKRFHPRHKNADMRMRMTDGHPDDFLMVFVGRLGSEKRCKDLKEVLAQMPGARLCFVGAGPQENVLKKHFEGLPVHFTGELHGDELCQTFASADVLSFPSDSETLGFVVMEAMASSIPVVAANGGGVPSMVRQGETGYLVEPGDTEEYVRVLKMLQADPDLRERLGQQGRLDAQTWSWEDSMSRITEVTYQQAQEQYNNRWNVRLWRQVFDTPREA